MEAEIAEHLADLVWVVRVVGSIICGALVALVVTVTLK